MNLENQHSRTDTLHPVDITYKLFPAANSASTHLFFVRLTASDTTMEFFDMELSDFLQIYYLFLEYFVFFPILL